jgi:hypothetical protein
MIMETRVKKKQAFNPITIYVGVGLLLVILNIVFVIFAGNEAKTITLLKQELKNVEQQQQIIASAQEIHGKYENEIDTINGVFPNEETITLFIQKLEETIRSTTDQYTFKFSSVTPLKEQDKLFLPLQITVKTDLSHFIAFLAEIEKLPYMTHITSMNGKLPDSFNKTGEMSINLKVYVQDPFTTR